MHSHHRYRVNDLEFDELVGQEPHRPTLVTLRCRRASQRGKARVKCSVESDIPRFARRLANQGRLQTFFDKTLFEVLYGAGADPQSGCHIGHFPRVTVLARIAQEQGASVEKLRGRGLPAAGELCEFGAFRLREGDFVSIGHAGEKSSKAKFAMRNYKCYEILVSRYDCRLPREQSYANVQGLQAIQCHEMEAPVGRFTAPTQDAIRQALRKANRRNSGFHAG